MRGDVMTNVVGVDVAKATFDVAFGLAKPGKFQTRAKLANRQEGFEALVAWLDQHALGWFAGLNAGLHDELDDDRARARLRGNIDLLHALAGSIGAHAARECPGLDVAARLAAAGARTRPQLFRFLARAA